jgi:hypothetical protein
MVAKLGPSASAHTRKSAHGRIAEERLFFASQLLVISQEAVVELFAERIYLEDHKKKQLEFPNPEKQSRKSDRYCLG